MVVEAYSKVLVRHCETIPNPTPTSGKNAKSKLAEGTDFRLMVDSNDCNVLHRAVLNGILGGVAGDSIRLVVLRLRLESGKDRYLAEQVEHA